MNQNEANSNRNYTGTPSLALNEHQEAALAQIECWLPQITFELHSRYQSSSASQNHLLALGRIFANTEESKNLTTSPSSIKEGWMLASIPSISDKIIITITQENPLPFVDFITGLDALSETADHIQHGFSAPINHSILNNRGQQSYILAEFNELWPRLQIKKQRPSQTSKAVHHHYIHRDENNFHGLVVLFSDAIFSKKETQNYNLQAIARSKQQLLDIALPQRSYTQEEDTTFEDANAEIVVDTETMIDTESFHLTNKTTNKCQQQLDKDQTDALELEGSSADIELLRRYTTYTPKRTYILFMVFLVISSIAFLYLP